MKDNLLVRTLVFQNVMSLHDMCQISQTYVIHDNKNVIAIFQRSLLSGHITTNGHISSLTLLVK